VRTRELLESHWQGVIACLIVAVACAGAGPGQQARVDTNLVTRQDNGTFARRREAMVTSQIEARGVTSPAVLAAMRKVPRHLFVPPDLADEAYADGPLPIGHQQTISQPYIVAYMSDVLDVDRSHKVLEIGTGSGYQAAVLGELAREVFTIEIVPELGEHARELLASLGYRNVHTRVGDGYLGWPEQAPFDRVIVTAAPDHVPAPLVDQLAVGGRMVLPVGTWSQEIVVLTKTSTGVVERRTIAVRFVPLTRAPRPE
jgi:protein-L-isoaspartate(D-aspartate) O-methyltransferase